jgi:acetyl-CoA C-acetyltransferase
MGRRVAIVGTGQTPYMRRRRDVSVPELVHEAAKRALDDAGLTFNDIDAVVFGTGPEAFEGVNCPDKWAADGVGALNKPFMRINTGGATGGSTALAGVHHVASGLFDVVLAVAMQRVGQTPVAQRILGLIWDPIFTRGFSLNLITTIAMATTASMRRFSHTEWHMAKISVKDHQNALNNPYAHRKRQIGIDDVLNSPVLCWPIKYLDCCPSSDGACAVIFASEERAKRITATPAWVIGMGATSQVSTPGEEDGEEAVGSLAAAKAYRMAGIDNPRRQISVVEPYDPFSMAEIGLYESLGFCKDPREATKMVEDGFAEMTGEVPFSPSGGVLCSNPIGATALVRVAEAALQIMGKAEKRQVPDAKVALAMGAGGSPAPGSATFINFMILAKEPR